MYHQLTSEQRSQIFALLQKKIKRKEIALIVGTSEATISRELKNNSTPSGKYIWTKAHDWKSCKRQKRFEGSNPSLSAIRTTRGSSGTLSPAIRYSRVCSRRGFLCARQAALSSVDKWVLRNKNL